MEKMQSRELVNEHKKRGNRLFTAHLCRVALFLALLFSGFQPALAASSPSLDLQQATGYWRFLEVVTFKAWLPPVGGSVISADAIVSDGHITISQIYGDPEPQKYIVDCTWTLSAPNGLDRLTPGEILNGSMTLTDQSQYDHTCEGCDHGYAGGGGEISIDQPYIGATGYTADSRNLLYFSVGFSNLPPRMASSLSRMSRGGMAKWG